MKSNESKNDKPFVIVYEDGIRDDTDAIEQVLNGEAVAIYDDGTPIAARHGRFKITRTIYLSSESEFPALDDIYEKMIESDTQPPRGADRCR